jgi:trimeric autotransporter adhesin
MVIDTIKVTVNAKGKGPKLVKLHVTPVDPTVSDFESLQFTAMGDFDDKSSHEVTDRVRWVSDKPDTLAIKERSGLATPGLVADDAWITAADDATGVNVSTEATVQVPKLVSIEIAPRDPSLTQGDTVPLTVTGTFSNQQTKEVTDKVAWSTNDKTVAAVVPVTNELFGAKEGTAEIGATVSKFPNVGDSINVTVLPPA